MEGQGKRLLLAVVLAFGVYLVWMMVFPPDSPKPGTGSGSGSGSGSVAAAAVVATSGVCKAGTDSPPAAEQQLERFKFANIEAAFSRRNSALVSWKLTDERYLKDPTKGELLPLQPDTGAFVVGFWRGSTICLPSQTEWKLDGRTDQSITFSLTAGTLNFVKTYTIVPEAYMIRMTLVVRPTTNDPLRQRLAISSYAYNNPEIKSGGMQVAAREWSSSSLTDVEHMVTPFGDIKESATDPGKPRYEANIVWSAFEHPYILAAYAPRRNAPIEPIAKHVYPESTYGLMRMDLEFPPELLTDPQHEIKREIVGYLGPKNYNQLKQADSEAGFESDFVKTIDLGWFGFIGRPLMWLLLKFHSVAGNWALAIIMLTFLVKGLTIYWTTKSMRSMKQMAALAPQMKALQDKYKNDRQRAQVETMALYKQHNVNPIAGCLPIFLQMPIWLALYRMLSTTGELYQQPFISGWIDDLTNSDPFHILPVVLLVTMFVQARLTPATGSSQQQKMMQYGLPLMFGVMSFFFPAGLTLYILTNTVLSALHSIYMNKYDKKSLAIMAQMKQNAAAADAAAAAAAKPLVAEPTATKAPNKRSDNKKRRR